MNYTKFARTLPPEHRNTPFVTAHIPKPTKKEVVAYLLAVAAWAITTYYLWPNK